MVEPNPNVLDIEKRGLRSLVHVGNAQYDSRVLHAVSDDHPGAP